MTRFREPVCLVSPHLDDGVLSCGYALGASPARPSSPSSRGCQRGPPARGTRSPPAGPRLPRRSPCVARRTSAPLASLPARRVWLDLLDGQYDDSPHDQRVAQVLLALRPQIEELAPRTVRAPVGIGHPDHLAVAETCVRLARGSAVEWWLYEDVPYAQTRRRVASARRRLLRILDTRRRALRAARAHVPLRRPVLVTGEPAKKRAAVECYASQLSALEGSATRYAEAVTRGEAYRRAWAWA